MARHPQGRVLVGAYRGDDGHFVPDFEDFTPKRFWFYGPSIHGWPIHFYRGGDEACNPTVVLATWLGSLVVVTSKKLNSSTPADEIAEFLREDDAMCPTSCDDDCDAVCHEWHQPRWRRLHQPEDCPGRRGDG